MRGTIARRPGGTRGHVPPSPLVTLPPPSGGLDIVVFGNSITEGVTTGLVPSQAWPAKLGDALEAAYGTGTHGRGWVTGTVSGGESWTLVNNSGLAGVNGFPQSFGLRGIAVGNTDTATQTLTGDHFRVACSTFNDYAGLGSITGGQLEVRVGGSLEATIQCHDAALTGTQATLGKGWGAIADVGPFTYGAHSVELKGTGGAGKACLIDGVYAYRQNYSSGNRIWNGARGSTQVPTSTNTELFRMLATVDPDLVIVQHMFNDKANSIATYTTNLEATITHIRSFCSAPIVLASEYQTAAYSPSTRSWAEMRAAMVSVALDNGCTYIDLGGKVGSLGYNSVADDPGGFLADGTHPDVGGHEYIAEVYEARLAGLFADDWNT